MLQRNENKKRYRKKVTAILFCGILAVGGGIGYTMPSSVYGKSVIETKVLKANKTYTYDLDHDGKKEKLKYILKANGNGGYRGVIISINGKNLYKKFKNANQAITLTIADLDRKDKALDLMLNMESESGTLEYCGFLQYHSGKMKTLSSSDTTKILNQQYSYELAHVDGSGTFSISVRTPYRLYSMGDYNGYVSLQLKNDKIIKTKEVTYTLREDSGEFSYELQRAIPVYQSPSKSSKKVSTLKAGDTLTIKKVKPIGQKSYVPRSKAVLKGYAYIEDKDGKVGWIYLDKTKQGDIELFKFTPGAG